MVCIRAAIQPQQNGHLGLEEEQQTMNHCGNENGMNKLLQIVEKHNVREIINLIVLYIYVHLRWIENVKENFVQLHLDDGNYWKKINQVKKSICCIL